MANSDQISQELLETIREIVKEEVAKAIKDYDSATSKAIKTELLKFRGAGRAWNIRPTSADGDRNHG